MLPTSASRHHDRLQRIKAVTVGAARRAWRQMRPERNWQQQYERDVAPALTALVLASQAAAATNADLYIAEVLNELDFGPVTEPGVIRPQAFAGFAGDGRPVATLLAQAPVVAGKAYNQARSTTPTEGDLIPREYVTGALEQAGAWMDMAVETLIADAARAAETVAMTQRPWLDGWVRVINPPCCARCAVLSGKFYLFNEGFLRHPRCDCYHLPAPKDPERVRALIDVNSPDRYFESLTEAEQDRIFTKAGAEAIRLGADVSQVVNARRGMRKAQLDGRTVLTTTEGTTRRGRGSARRNGRSSNVRLMPETILSIAEDHEQAIRLLRVNGYLA